jgi:hypothetical protein
LLIYSGSLIFQSNSRSWLGTVSKGPAIRFESLWADIVAGRDIHVIDGDVPVKVVGIDERKAELIIDGVDAAGDVRGGG